MHRTRQFVQFSQTYCLSTESQTVLDNLRIQETIWLHVIHFCVLRLTEINLPSCGHTALKTNRNFWFWGPMCEHDRPGGDIDFQWSALTCQGWGQLQAENQDKNCWHWSSRVPREILRDFKCCTPLCVRSLQYYEAPGILGLFLVSLHLCWIGHLAL